MKLGFIGLGTMGAPMAKRLANAGHKMSVYDVNSKVASEFVDLPNCRVAGSPKDAALDVECVITMLPESRHVRDAILGSNGAVRSMGAGSVVIDMSTGDPELLQNLAYELAIKKIGLVDAPVGRTPAEAQTGQLLVLAGGKREDLEHVEPILACLGDEIVYAGPLGSGLKLKLINNYMGMIGMVMTAEALNLARMANLDVDQVVEVLQKTPAGQGQINTNFPKKVLSGDITPDFPLRLGLKDISLGLTLAQSTGAPTPLGSAAQQIFALSLPWMRADQDCTAMLHLLSDLSGPKNSTGRK
ncbi:MAG: NAD-binding protein [Verrucomicrobia bacterium]|jgi:4-hydroxybutyrate dehydrogenase / sulfolactaldehyde 3-reductase|nr:NAD-binding protein [Verrucomicrobiota bacterium]MBT6097840.1 NAD-binding protein [Marinovum sp.]MBT6526791.1 NAD-binding protein [Marinovum sp.]